MFVSVCAVIILAETGSVFFGIFASVENMFSGAELSYALAAAMKILGIGYLFGICSDVCRELGESTLAKVTEVVGRAESLMVILL